MLRGSHDNWEKLVAAVLDREELRRIACCESSSSSISDDFSSRLSFDSASEVCRSHGQSSNPAYLSSQNIFFSPDVMAIEYKEIRKATRNFWGPRMNREAVVTPFKGWIDEDNLTAVKPGCGIAVAVNMIDLERLKVCKEWVDGINCWSRLLHPNLVKLIGCSFDKHNRILVVHEFMAKGSLDNHLFRRPHILPWQTRIRVAVGAARALSFLHDLEIPVTHQNIMSSSNILLDGVFNTKLMYFGLAGPQVKHIYAYDAPEYFATGSSTIRSDVYGFGVILLELLSGLRRIDRNRPMNMLNLVDWAKPYLRDEKRVLRVMDKRIEGEYPLKEAYKVGKIALKCVSLDPRLRPRMSEVVAELEKL